MSTQRLERRRIHPVTRRADPRRIAVWFAIVAGVFAVAFGIGHIRRSGDAIVERTPPRLSAVPTPVPSALASAPAIKLAVVRHPAAPTPSPAAKSPQPAVTPTVVTTTPEASAPAPTPTPAPTPEPVAPPSKPAPAPSGGGQHSSGGSGGGGTSFESSG